VPTQPGKGPQVIDEVGHHLSFADDNLEQRQESVNEESAHLDFRTFDGIS
jgi:hypothetical protein